MDQIFSQLAKKALVIIKYGVKKNKKQNKTKQNKKLFLVHLASELIAFKIFT